VDLIIPSDLNKVTLIQVKPSVDVLKSNLQQLHEIELYHVRNPQLSINEAAIQWIDNNAKDWRTTHPLSI
jgi:hypothetical protein